MVIPFSSYKVEAQTGATIETSADDNGGRFFGGLLRVVIEDPTADDGGAESRNVEIKVADEGGNTATSFFTIPNTVNGSQRFEFFMAHEDFTDGGPDGAESPAPTIITFGDGAGADIKVDGFFLYDKGSIVITFNDQERTISYDESAAELISDRDTYGSTGIIHLFVIDQDANLDPTAADSFIVTEFNANHALFHLTGGAFVDDLSFHETGDNNAEFEAVLQLTFTDSSINSQLRFYSEMITIELQDMADYYDPANHANDASTSTSAITISIDDVDGQIDELGVITFGSEFQVTLRDADQNIDSQNIDSIQDALVVQIDSAGGDTEILDLIETDDNTGVFVIDMANSELRMTFLADDAAPIPINGILELRPSDISSYLIGEYFDPLDDDSVQSVTSQFVFQLTTVNGKIGLPDSGKLGDSVTLTLSDADLNDNQSVIDSYTVTLTGQGPYPLKKGGAVYSEIGQFQFSLDGDQLNFATPVVITLTETAANSSQFVATINLGNLLSAARIQGQAGDKFEVTYRDFTSGGIASSDVLVIGGKLNPSAMLKHLIEFSSNNNVDAGILKSAEKLLNDGNPKNDHAVCSKLDAFKSQVMHQSGKKISSGLAKQLQIMTVEIKDQLRC